MTKRTPVRALALPALLAALPLAAQAQTPTEPAPVSVSAKNAPVAVVLRSLFKSAAVRFVIDADVQGSVNADLNAVPFPVALKQVLASVAVPLTFSVENGVYHVQVKSSAPAQAELLVSDPFNPAAPTSEDAGQSRFYRIGIKHYDPGVIAELLTHQTGIVDVPPNFVIPSGANVPTVPSGPAGIITVRATSAFGPAVPFGGTPASTGPGSAPSAAYAALPDGVKRIFVRHSDNSLVIEATPEAMAGLMPLLKETNL